MGRAVILKVISSVGDAVLAVEGWYYTRRERIRRNRNERYFWV